MYRTAISCSITLAITCTCFAQAIRPGRATIAKFTTKEETYTGELLEEADSEYSMLDFKTGRIRKLDRRIVKTVRRDIKEYEVIQTVGLSNYLAWQVQRSTKAGRVQGQVAAIDESAIYVNVGSNHGIEPGVHLQIIRLGEAITDPASGSTIGYKQTSVGVIQVMDVQEQLSKAEFVEPPQEEPRVGDAVRLPPEKDAVGIFPLVNARNWETVYSRRLAEELTTGLVQRGIRVVERRLLARVAGELKLQSTSWFDPAAAKEVGKLVGAEAIVIGTVTPKKQYAEAQIRLINVETGEILAAVTHRLRNENMTPVTPFSTLMPMEVDSTGLLKGTWIIELSNQRGRRYAIDIDGQVTWGEKKGQLKRKGGVAFLNFGDGRLESLRLNAGVLEIERFRPPETYPRAIVNGKGRQRMDMGNDLAKVLKEISGVWVIRYTNDAVRRYEIKQDGTVDGDFERKTIHGKLILKNGDLLFDCGDDTLERIELHGQRLLTERYNPREKYPHTINVLGKGKRE